MQAGTGAVLWQTRYPAPYAPIAPAAAHGAGPKATPIWYEGRLYTLGISGIVSKKYVVAGEKVTAEQQVVTIVDLHMLELAGITWQVLAGAGHDPHMVMLFEPEARILISADALWEDGFGGIADGFDIFARIQERDDAARAAFQPLIAPRERADDGALAEHQLDVAA